MSVASSRLPMCRLRLSRLSSVVAIVSLRGRAGSRSTRRGLHTTPTGAGVQPVLSSALFHDRSGGFSMGTFRLFTDAGGQSRVETIDLAKTAEWTQGLATTKISFSEWPVGRFLD